MVMTNELLQLSKHNLAWRQTVNIPTNCVQNITLKAANTHIITVQNARVVLRKLMSTESAVS